MKTIFVSECGKCQASSPKCEGHNCNICIFVTMVTVY